MNSTFSEFFRNATYEEKERVWKQVMREVAREQMEIINSQADEETFIGRIRFSE